MLRSLHHHLLLLGFGLFPLPRRRRRPLLPSSVASISSSPSAAAAASAAPPPQLGAFRMASGGSETSPDADVASAAAAAAAAAAAEVAPPPVHKSKIRFCQACGSPTKQVVPQGEEKLRAVCTVCGKIHYENPKMVVGCLVVHDNKILLCKRKIEPSYGLWTLPAGYLEVGESAAEGATRETLEEARAEVEILSPFAQLDIPQIGQSFRAPMAMASSKITAPKALPKEAEAEAAGANRLLQLPILRREVLLISMLPLNLSALALPSHARERRARKTISPEEYSTSPDGLKYYDIIDGKGPTAEKGAVVQVHFDCMYRGITAVSSRESKLLAGNRSIAQPYEFTVGSPPGKERKRDFVDNANGLYSAQAAPKPPPAMYTITEGMKVGGKRTVIVPPELGYGKKGMNEIPPGAEFQLNIELLQVTPPGGR